MTDINKERVVRAAQAWIHHQKRMDFGNPTWEIEASRLLVELTDAVEALDAAQIASKGTG